MRRCNATVGRANITSKGEIIMTVSGQGTLVYPRLCLAFFCQLAIWGAWAIALGGYAHGVLNFTGAEIGWLYAAIPLGAIIAPLFIGPIADRYFAAQKVMALLHFIGGLALIACGVHCVISESPSFLLILALMLLSGICYMPTMGLMNSVIFKHLPNPSLAPYVFVWGTIGWIAVSLVIAGILGGADTPNFFFVAGSVGVFLALYSLTLPDTPPKGAPVAGEKSAGGGAFAVLTLFKSFPFTIFVICAFLASIPASNYFFPALGPFLAERGYPAPVALATICQFAEIAFMLALPYCIAKFGLKKVLLIGMAAWSIRYFCFAEPYFALVVFGLVLHGFGYTFLYVASYMYAEKVAPAHLKASAQSMMIFLLLGVGQILGGQGYGFMRDANPPKHATIAVQGTSLVLAEGDRFPDVIDVGTDKFMIQPIPAWNEAEDSWFQYLDLATQFNKLMEYLFPPEEEVGSEDAPIARAVDFRELLDGQPLTPAAIRAMDPARLVQDNVRVLRMEACCPEPCNATFAPFTATVEYTRDDLIAFGRTIAGTDDFSVDRSQWLAAQAHNWTLIWHVPALFIFVCFLIFFILGRDPKEETPETDAKG